MLYSINKKIISFRNKSLKYVIIFILLFFFVTVVTSAQSNGNCGVMAGGMNFFTTGFGGGVLPLSNNSQACTTMNPVDFTAPSDVASAATSMNANPSSYRPGGAIGLLAQVGEYSMSSVADSRDAVTFIADHVNPNKVSAQSSALQGLAPILVLWGIARNLCYILIAIALVVTGLVLYFANRAGGKSNNNTVLGVMVSEVVATLIFITLSYPIGAIVVDLVINLGNAVIASTFNPFINSNTILANLYAPGSGTNIISLLGDIQKVGVSGSTVNLIQSGLSYLSTPLSNASTFLTSVLRVPGTDPVTAFFNIPVTAVFGTLVSIYFGIAQGITNQGINSSLIIAIISFTVFLLIFRIVFLLLGSFVGIILTIGFSPFILVSGAFPGVSTFQVFSNWIKRLISLSLVYPITFGLLLLSGIFLNLSQTPNQNVTSDGKNQCVYQNDTPSDTQNKVNIIGTSGNSSDPGTYTNTNSSYFNVNRFDSKVDANGNPVAIDSGDTNASTRNCFPILLPPKFNWLPAPIGNFGTKFEIDDFTRYVLGLAFIIIIPNIVKVIQDALKIKSPQLASIQDAVAGAGLLSTFVGQIPVVGKPISQVIGSVTSIAK